MASLERELALGSYGGQNRSDCHTGCASCTAVTPGPWTVTTIEARRLISFAVLLHSTENGV